MSNFFILFLQTLWAVQSTFSACPYDFIYDSCRSYGGFSIKTSSLGSMTLDKCHEYCVGRCPTSYPSFGVSINYCYCGTLALLTSTSTRTCGNWPCPGNPSQQCGYSSSYSNTKVRVYTAAPGSGCDQDCVGCWTDWSACSSTCPGVDGTRTRSFTTNWLGQLGGTLCPSSTDTQVCSGTSDPVFTPEALCYRVGGSYAGTQDPSGYVDLNKCWNFCQGLGTPYNTFGVDNRYCYCDTLAQLTSTSTTSCSSSWTCPNNGAQLCGKRFYGPDYMRVYTGEIPVCTPVHCSGTWSAWTACPVSCGGGGSQSRIFTETVAAENGGNPCPSSPETQVCGTSPCPVDCDGTWSAWTACSLTCGGGSQSRAFTETVAAANGGNPCPSSPETQTCNTADCPHIDCSGTWSAWTPCSVTCGGGSQSRAFTESVAAAYGGNPCPSSPETQTCNTAACPPIDCSGTWSAWTPCSLTCGGGSQSRAFTESVAAANGGNPCPSSPETQACNTAVCPPVDCSGTWSAWTPCPVTCGGGPQSRAFTETVAAANGGNPCPSSPETQACNTAVCPPVDCSGTWSAWTPCSVTCGGGSQSRAFIESVAAAYGGNPCPSSPETQSCGTIDCNECDSNPCLNGATCMDLTNGYHCICPSGYNSTYCDTEINECESNPCSNGGICVNDVNQYHCICPSGYNNTHCENDINECESNPCANGGTCLNKVGGYDCICMAGFNSTHCENDFNECDSSPCISGATCVDEVNGYHCITDCTYSWSSWNACNVTCGGGMQERTINITIMDAFGGTACPPSPEYQGCNYNQCPIECSYIWSDWDTCTVTCGGGMHQRYINITAPPEFGGTPCPTSPENQTCNDGPCAVDCGVSQWSNWTLCTATCGNKEMRMRTRTVQTEPLNGGDECPSLTEKESCLLKKCIPMSAAEAVVAEILQVLGCIWILSALAATMGAFLLLRIMSLERMIHFCEELSLFIGHLFVLFLRDKVDSIVPCKIASACMQYFFTVHFVFMPLEATQSYCIITNVISVGGFLAAPIILALGWGIPLVTTGLTAIAHEHYISDFSCWLNLDNNLMMGTVLPIGISSVLAVIVVEAAGLGQFHPLPSTEKAKVFSAQLSRQGILIKLPISIGSWFLGLFAVYYQNIGLYTLVCAMNISIGTAIFVIHSLGDKKVRALFLKLWKYITCKK